MNWFWLVVGIAVGAVGQRWLGRIQRRRVRLSEGMAAGDPPVAEAGDEISHGSAGDDDLLWIAYVRALERAQFQGGFLARVAHELRSPLSSLMGLQQLILADLCDDSEEERQCVAQSYEAAQNLHRLMDQLIRVSKLEQGSQRLDIQPIALDVLLEDVESFVQLQVADRNARLQLHLPAQPVYAQADYNSLRQVLVMLLEVALSQRACELHLTLKACEQGVKLEFRADQPVIPVQELKAQLQQDSAGLWNREDLIQLKQSCVQEPGAGFVPHRLSPSMVLLISQLLLDLNGATLRFAGDSEQSVKPSSQGEFARAGAEIDAEQAYALEIGLTAA